MKKGLGFWGAGILLLTMFWGLAGLAAAEEAEPSGANKALQLKENLGLTDDQVAKLTAIRESEKSEVKPRVLQGLSDLKTLGEKVKAGAPDAELNLIVDKIEANRIVLEGLKTKYITQVRTVLNPTQQSKLVLAVAAVKLGILQKVLEPKKGK